MIQNKKIQQFIIRSILFLSTILVSIFFIFLQVDGYTDDFYIKFTTPKQNSLILGTSRASQGLQPTVLKEILDKEIFNYAFTAASSPFGTTYLNSIKRKTTTNDGVFIITIDPWSISSTTKNPNDSNNFRETTSFLARTSLVNANPNLEYLFESFNGNYSKLFKKDTSIFLHNDGWLEVSVDMSHNAVKKRTDEKVNSYLDIFTRYHYSEVRLQSLDKTIDYLKQYGNVYLIRLPIHPKMMVIENELMPDFEAKISLTKTKCTGYLDLTPYNSDYSYTDGNHIHKNSGKLVSQKIANWIQLFEKK